MNIWIPILAVTVIGLICGVGLSVASHFMAVKEDERIAAVRACLPGANCGACGFSGCDGYAKALVEDGVKTNLCVPGADAAARKISELLGVEAEDVVEKVAIVHCSGTCEATNMKYDYDGMESCAAAKLYFGGHGACSFGCIGLGDCLRACPNGGIRINKGIAQVDTRSCMGCGMCAKVCPQQLIEIVPDVTKVVVRCSSREKGASTRKLCTAGCIGCKKCEKTCEHGAITVVNNVASIDYEKCVGCGKCAAECPVGCLVEGDFSGMHRG